MNLGKPGIVLGYGIPSLIMLAAAFWAGAQKDPVMGMLGFVPFFMASAFLAIQGFKKLKGSSEEPGENRDEK